MTKFSGKKQYQVYHSDIDDIGCVIEIDFDYPDILSNMKEYYDFYHSNKNAVDETSLVILFLKHIAGAVFHVSANGKLNTHGVRNAIAEWEGYPKLDGTEGIRLMQHDHQEVEDSDFRVKPTSDYKYFEAK